jgi:hypothetical protein
MSSSEEVYNSGTLWWHLLVKIPMHAGEAAPSPTTSLLILFEKQPQDNLSACQTERPA